MAEDTEQSLWANLPLKELQNVYELEKFGEATMSDSEFILLRSEILRRQIDLLKNNNKHTTESATLEMAVAVQTMQEEYLDSGYVCEAVWDWHSQNGQRVSDNSVVLNTILTIDTTVDQIRDLLPIGIQAPVILGQDSTQRVHSVLTVKIENLDDPVDRTIYSLELFPKDSSIVIEIMGSESSKGTIKKEWEELVAPIDYKITILKN